jgi:hypothetical protein
VAELRLKGVSETCPLCRAPLPPGPEKLLELGLIPGVGETRSRGEGWRRAARRPVVGAFVVTTGRDGRRNRDAAAGDGPGEQGWSSSLTFPTHSLTLSQWHSPRPTPGRHLCSRVRWRHLLLGPGRGGELLAGDGGVQGRGRGGRRFLPVAGRLHVLLWPRRGCGLRAGAAMDGEGRGAR